MYVLQELQSTHWLSSGSHSEYTRPQAILHPIRFLAALFRLAASFSSFLLFLLRSSSCCFCSRLRFLSSTPRAFLICSCFFLLFAALSWFKWPRKMLPGSRPLTSFAGSFTLSTVFRRRLILSVNFGRPCATISSTFLCARSARSFGALRPASSGRLWCLAAWDLISSGLNGYSPVSLKAALIADLEKLHRNA